MTGREGQEQAATAADLAEQVNGTLRGQVAQLINGVQTLEKAQAHELSFFSGVGYAEALKFTQAGLVILSKPASLSYAGAVIIVDNPHLAFAKATSFLYPQSLFESNISAQSQVHETAQVSVDASIAAGAVIEADAIITSGVVIAANCTVGQRAQIGKNTRLDANVTVYADSIIGSECHVLSGAVLGSDGFGFARDTNTWLKVPQVGRVIIGNRVHIGANTCIDRGSIGDTIVSDDVIIDNLVQIAHNVKIGRFTAIAGCAAIAGSTTIGENGLIAGRVSIIGHLHICDNVQINVDTLVTKSIDQAGIYAANWPAQPVRRWRRMLAGFKKNQTN